jgi:hypothetical protein
LIEKACRVLYETERLHDELIEANRLAVQNSFKALALNLTLPNLDDEDF